jgi:phosphoribosylformylglycinamidine synthase
MAQVALDEAIRNAVCVGADPSTLSVLDNFCWPDPVVSANNPNGKKYLGMLVRACQGLYEAAVFMGTPLISGKDSMKNDFDDGVVRLSVPPTLLVSAMGKVPNINKCITSDFKNSGDQIYLCSAATLGLSGSILSTISSCDATLCSLNLEKALSLYKKLHEAIVKGLINSAHDVSDGGLAVTLAESTIGSNLGANITIEPLLKHMQSESDMTALFGEGPGHIVVTVSKQHQENFLNCLRGCDVLHIGEVSSESQLNLIGSNGKTTNWSFDELRNAWNEPLPFA